MKTLNELFRSVILLNELDGNEKIALRFSDPDGKPGRSGWSFGICQFDTRHNPVALECLKKCGFTRDEIDGIVDQTIDVRPLGARLNAEIVAKYDEAQLSYCLYSAMNTATSKGIMVTNPAAILCLADYINQYGSIGPSFVAYLNEADLDGDVTAAEVQEWKLKHTKYGKEHPGDCERRYKNILKVVATI